MEKLKAKHDHKLTDILKVGVFGLFLLMPFLTFMPTALYYGFNEHAVNETTTEVNVNYKYESNEVNSLDDLVEGHIYYIDDSIDFYDTTGDYYYLNVLKCKSLSGETFQGYTNININNYDSSNNNLIYVELDAGTGELYVKVSNLNGYVEYFYDTDVYLDEFVFIYNNSLYNFLESESILPQYTDYNEIESVDVQEDVEQTISQQMYKSWQTMWQSPFYNWTNQSVLKTGLDNFTSVFGVSNNSYITNLLTYELIIVAIYIVIDIVITLFTWLTHLFNSKE